ncbi:MAG: hypothetical protein KGL39_00590 [Patescibacteria group bacterium]|nr:hypothetical protein [Patescibacteria group bacterium]
MAISCSGYRCVFLDEHNHSWEGFDCSVQTVVRGDFRFPYMLQDPTIESLPIDYEEITVGDFSCRGVFPPQFTVGKLILIGPEEQRLVIDPLLMVENLESVTRCDGVKTIIHVSSDVRNIGWREDARTVYREVLEQRSRQIVENIEQNYGIPQCVFQGDQYASSVAYWPYLLRHFPSPPEPPPEEISLDQLREALGVTDEPTAHFNSEGAFRLG